MSEPKLISPMLDQFAMGDPISDHNGVRCCPAMRNDTDDRYIVKIISVPASQTQLEALLLTGAYPDTESALEYFKTLTDETVAEVNTLQKLSEIEGFVAFEDIQVVPMEGEAGFDIYLLSPYRRTLTKHFVRSPMTQLSAINLGLDLCAALAVCRRSGYLCIDLKPNNIFVTPEQEFKIGDIGFARLDSLKYASLPDKYRSAYTAPEIADAFSSLNDRIDVYALGLILYQAYNNGELPFTGTTPPEEPFAPPMFADYEMSEIILKACARDPEDRWQDPIQMGQALVGYMQRNGANDTPIVPPAPVMEEVEEVTVPEQTEAEVIKTDVPDTAESSQPEEAEVEDETVYHEDPEGNLSFLESLEFDESELEQSGEKISYEVLSDEASQILAQADELAELSVPDPVVAPEPVEITVPDPVMPEQEETSEEINEYPAEETAEDILAEDAYVSEEKISEDTDEAPAAKKKSSGRWLRIFIPVVLLLALLAGGVYYYINYYLQPIESVVVSGSEDSLTVFVTSMIDDSKLTVICSDAYGNQIPAPVTNGKAVFTNLIPDTGYNIYVQIDGFHKLTGQTSAAYSTPVQTSIVQFNAVTGSEDGSVILSFTVDGKDAENWTVIYSAEDEEERTASFSAHTVTLTGLTVGKEYTFTLATDADLYLTGIEQITYTASELVYAENLMVTGCVNTTLTAAWSSPADKSIESWTVRCYNDNYNETIITTETIAVFENLNHTESFTVEVIAAGMSVSQRVYVPENSVTVTNFKADSTDSAGISLNWNTSSDIPQGGWVLQYQIEGTDIKDTVTCTENSAKISPVIPGCTYNVSLQDSSGNALLGGVISCAVPEAGDFAGTYSSQRVTRSNLNFNMCYALDWANGRYSNAEHSTEFSVGQKACFIVRLGTSTTSRRDPSSTTVSYVIRDASGKPVSISGEMLPWTQMWNGSGFCKLDIPNMPDAAGSYTISIYFNGALAHEQSFTVSA